MPEHLLAIAVVGVAIGLFGLFYQRLGAEERDRASFQWRNLGRRYLSPTVIEFLVFVSVVALVSTRVLSLADMQTELWLVTILTVLVGDSGTTALLAKRGIEGGDLGYTRWICGELSSVGCAFMSRAIILFIVGGIYFGLLSIGGWGRPEFIFETILYIPVILAAGGLAATLINVQTLLAHKRNS